MGRFICDSSQLDRWALGGPRGDFSLFPFLPFASSICHLLGFVTSKHREDDEEAGVGVFWGNLVLGTSVFALIPLFPLSHNMLLLLLSQTLAGFCWFVVSFFAAKLVVGFCWFFCWFRLA